MRGNYGPLRRCKVCGHTGSNRLAALALLRWWWA